MWPWFASPDGHTLLYEESGRSGNYSGWKLPLEGPPIPGHLAPRDFDQEWVQISPDGRWLAYNSDDSGRQEVYVTPFPALDSNVKVSAAGGRYPQWSPNGRELYYLENDAADNQPVSRRMKLMAVPLETSPQLKAGTPQMLFAGPFIAARRDYAVTPDGKGFIFIRESQPGSGPGEMKVVLGWDNELKRRLPVN